MKVRPGGRNDFASPLDLLGRVVTVSVPDIPLWVPAALGAALIATPTAAAVSQAGAPGLLGICGVMVVVVAALLGFWALLPVDRKAAVAAGETGLSLKLAWAARWATGLAILSIPLAGSTWVLDTYDLPKQSTCTILQVAMLVLWCAARVAGRPAPMPVMTWTALAGTLFMLAAAFSVPRAVNTLVAVMELGRIVLGVATLVVVHDLSSDSDFAQRVLGLGLAGALALCVLSIVQSLGYEVPGFPQVIPPAACFGNKNMATEYLVLLYSVPCVMVLWGDHIVTFWAGCGATLVTTFVLGASHTRADWLAALAVLGVLALAWASQMLDTLFPKDGQPRALGARAQVLTWAGCALMAAAPAPILWVLFTRTGAKLVAAFAALLAIGTLVQLWRSLEFRDDSETSRRAQTRLLFRAGAMAAMIVLGVIMFLNLGLIAKWFGKSGGVAHMASVGTSTAFDDKRHSTVWRVAAWGNTMNMVKQHPMFGVGAANWQYQYPLYHRSYLLDEAFDTRTQATTLHNDFLQYWAELGIPGFLGFFGLFIGLAFCVAAAMRAPNGRWAAVGLSGAAGCYACATDALFSFPFKLAAPTFMFWVLFALAHRATREIEGVPPGEEESDPPAVVALRLKGLLMAATLGGALLCGWAVSDWKASVAMRRAYVTSNEGKWPQSIPDFVQAAEDMNYVYNPYLLLGRAYYTSGYLWQAAAANELAAKFHPHHCNIFFNLANCYRDLGRMDLAIKAFEESARLYPGNTDAWTNLAGLYRAVGKNDKALEAYQKMLQFNPGSTDAALNVAQMLAMVNRIPEAVDALKKAIKANKNFYRAHQALGAIYQSQGKLDLANAEYERALAIDPGYVDAWNNIAGLAWQRGDAVKAKHGFDRALALQPTYGPAFFGLADMYYRDRKRELALHAYTRFLELWQHNDQHRQIAAMRLVELRNPSWGATQSATPTVPTSNVTGAMVVRPASAGVTTTPTLTTSASPGVPAFPTGNLTGR